MRYAIYMSLNTKDLAINQMTVAYGNRQNETTFARTNSSDLLRALEHLMETRLNAEMAYLWREPPVLYNQYYVISIM